MFDPSILSQVIQMIITIVTTVGALWALISKKESETKADIKRLESRLVDIQALAKENLIMTKNFQSGTHYISPTSPKDTLK